MKHIVVVHTGGGARYSKRILSSVRWIAEHTGQQIKTHLVPASGYEIQSLLQTLPMNDTVVHCRAAHPDAPFMDVLSEAEFEGWKVVNHPDVLRQTSDKASCALLLQRKFPHPKTWVVEKNRLLGSQYAEMLATGRDFVIKPAVSNGQGKYVARVELSLFTQENWWNINKIPGDHIVVQEFVPYTSIYRVICIGGKALPFAFKDSVTFHPDNWKVSVCLNKQQVFIKSPSYYLLNLAERVQAEIGGEINFIDIFELEQGQLILSEINTACSLIIHERLAKAAHEPRWNIHYRIAKYLVNKLNQED